MSEHLVPLWNERFPSVPLCLCKHFRRPKGGWTAFRMGVCHGWKEWCLLFLSCARRFFPSHRRNSTGEVSLSIRSHVACVSNHRKTITRKSSRRGSDKEKTRTCWRDWQQRVWTDSNAGKGIASRRGLGKPRHLDLKDVASGGDQLRKSEDEAGVPGEQHFPGPVDEGKIVVRN